ncbi:MAG TPA: GNAT family N-acetyltransferase [Candidatus Humimicrobiaceae bacterium]|nr:GNAT family N-acetyltransferase [Candidatus Humimicrobiaceae bacterium]
MYVRSAELKDIPELVRLGKTLFDQHILYDGEYYTLEENFEEHFGRWLNQLITDNFQFLYVAQTSEGEITGFISGFVKNLFSWFVIKKVGHISFLIVKDIYRQKKIGTMLENTASDWFRKQGIKYIETYVDEKNSIAQQAWTSYGFLSFKKFIRKNLSTSI